MDNSHITPISPDNWGVSMRELTAATRDFERNWPKFCAKRGMDPRSDMDMADQIHASCQEALAKRRGRPRKASSPTLKHKPKPK